MFHFRLVHFPIAFLILGAAIELIGLFADPEDKWRPVGTLLIGVGFLSSLAAVVTGLWLYDPEVHEEALIIPHRNFAFVTLAISGVTLLFYGFYEKLSSKKWSRYLRVLLFLLSALFVGITGHYGGTATHGDSDEEEVQMIQPPESQPSDSSSQTGGEKEKNN